MKANYLPQNLRELRQRSGLKQREIAGAFGWSAQKYSRMETGAGTPDPGELERLAKYHQLTIQDLTSIALWMIHPNELAAMQHPR